VIRENNLIVLKGGSLTHLKTHNTFTPFDISLISPQIADRCSWIISDNLHGSDRFPITIHIATPTHPDNTRPLPKYRTDQANWERFNEICEKSAVIWTAGCLNQQVAQMTKAIRAAANCSIPQTKRVIHTAKVELRALTAQGPKPTTAFLI